MSQLQLCCTGIFILQWTNFSHYLWYSNKCFVIEIKKYMCFCKYFCGYIHNNQIVQKNGLR